MVLILELDFEPGFEKWGTSSFLMLAVDLCWMSQAILGHSVSIARFGLVHSVLLVVDFDGFPQLLMVKSLGGADGDQ